MPHPARAAKSPLWVFVLIGVALATSSEARVLRIEIERRVPILEGRSFGAAGGYELLEGKVHFGFDPANPANARVADLQLAPRGEDGLVHAWSEWVVLQAQDPAKRSGTALVEVPNRGRMLALAGLNRAPLDFEKPAPLDPSSPEEFGDGFLMEQGLTLIWVGWQADAPTFPGSMRLRVPRAVNPDGSPVRGLARSDWVVEEPTPSLPLAAMGHRPHPAADPSSAYNVLTRRQAREGSRRIVPRERWRFSEDGTQIEMESGFKPAIYELVYPSQGPPTVGLGLAAFRDIAAYARHEETAAFPVRRSIATGSSQSGRFLRHFLYEGFNEDEAGRQVYEGMIIQIAGAGRGGFNHRFSHPGRVGNPFQDFFYPGDDAPFTSRPSDAGEAARGLLDRTAASKTLPKLFQINTGYEYWGRVASLVHMTPDGARDVEPLESERLYHIASAPHYSLPFPPAAATELAPGVYRGSSIDTSYVGRSMLVHMQRWVEDGTEPPASRIPRIDAGTLVEASALEYPIPLLRVPRTPHVAYRMNFGPRFNEGIIDQQPPRRGPAYAVRVPAIDSMGNEKTGIRLLELRAPIGTYTPWSLRTGHAFAEDEMVGYVGSFLPLSRARKDERPSLAELYPSQEVYEKRVSEEIESLVREGWLLPRDRTPAREAAMKRWVWIAGSE